MTKQERELRAQAEQLKTEARTLIAQDKMEDAKSKAAEAKNLVEKADLMRDLEEKQIDEGKPADPVAKDEAEQAQQYKNAFFKALCRKNLNADDRAALSAQNSLSESTEENGGLLVPKDVQTQIHTYMRDLPQLQPLIRTIPVSTMSGTYTFEKIATMTPFANITDDDADINKMDNPTFEKISYSIQKYAGWLPIPNDLLKDSDQNIQAYLTQWIGKKSVVTRNTLILAILETIAKTTFEDYKAIKKALNVTLDSALAVDASVLTNQDGFQYLDTLEDNTGKPILQVDITKPSQKLFAGKPVKVISNKVLKTTGTEKKLAPILVGNFKETIAMFERQGYEIASTNVGGDAFHKDRTELRAIEREDVKQVDKDATVYGQIDVTQVLS